MNITSPLLDVHSFRQTQTAISVQNFVNEGVSVLHYQTPVLGEPWTLPMEFPIFQLSAYLIYKLIRLFSSINLDVALRITNIIYFYCSLFYLYKFIHATNESLILNLCICTTYLLCPFNIFWSRTSMIESCVCFFDLAYIYYLYKFMTLPNLKYFILSIISGSLGYLTKSTTMIPFCIFISFYIINIFYNSKYLTLEYIFNKCNTTFITECIFLIISPALCGLWWLHYSDQLKIASGFTALSSSSLKVWNFGTLDQKLNLLNWFRIAIRLKYFSPITIWITLIISTPYLYIRNKIIYNAFTFSIVACILTIFLCFNLYYVHDYYLCALSPFICIILGYYYSIIIKYIVNKNYVKYLIMLFTVYIYIISNTLYIKSMFKNIKNYPIISLGEYIQNTTNAHDRLLIFDDDWSSEIPYYSNRKACMVWPPILKEPFKKYYEKYKIIITSNNPNQVINDMPYLSQAGVLYLDNSISSWNVYKQLSYNRVNTLKLGNKHFHVHIIKTTKKQTNVYISGYITSNADCKIVSVYYISKNNLLYPAIYGINYSYLNINEVKSTNNGFILMIKRKIWNDNDNYRLVVIYKQFNALYIDNINLRHNCNSKK